MTPAMPAGEGSAPVSTPAVSAPSPSIETFSEPGTQSAGLSVDNEIDALIAGTELPAGDDFTEGDIPAGEIPEGELPVVNTAPPSAEGDAPAADALPATPAPTDAATPEGVRLRTIDGKKAWVVDPVAGQAAFARASLVDEAERIFGEPLTKDALEFRQNTVKSFNSMRMDMLSDSPADTKKFVDGIAFIVDSAQKAGEIGHDALGNIVKMTIDNTLADGHPMADSMAKHIASNPKVLNSIIQGGIASNPEVINQMIQNGYERALNEADPAVARGLWMSMQWLDRLNNNGTMRLEKELAYLREGGYKTLPNSPTKPAAAPPAAAPAAPAAAAPAAPAPNQAFNAWHNATDKEIGVSAVTNPVNELLTAKVPAAQQKAFPNFFKGLQDRLTEIVKQGVINDPSLREQREIVTKRARMATNPDIRNQLQAELVRQHVDTAKRILRESQGPILTEYAQLVSAQSKDRNARVDASTRAGRQAPGSGGQSGARAGVPPSNNGKFNSNADFEKEFSQSLS